MIRGVGSGYNGGGRGPRGKVLDCHYVSIFDVMENWRYGQNYDCGLQFKTLAGGDDVGSGGTVPVVVLDKRIHLRILLVTSQ